MAALELQQVRYSWCTVTPKVVRPDQLTLPTAEVDEWYLNNTEWLPGQMVGSEAAVGQQKDQHSVAVQERWEFCQVNPNRAEEGPHDR